MKAHATVKRTPRAMISDRAIRRRQSIAQQDTPVAGRSHSAEWPEL